MQRLKLLALALLGLIATSCSQNGATWTREMLAARETARYFVSVSLDHNDVAGSSSGGAGVLVIEVRRRANSHYEVLRDDHIYKANYDIDVIIHESAESIEIVERKARRSWRIDVETGAISLAKTTKPSSVMAIDDILKSRETPALVAAGFEMEKLPAGLTQISFYEVTAEKAPARVTAKDLKPGICLVYTKDEIFGDDVRSHFHGLAHPDEFSGSTMWATLYEKVGSPFEVITIGRDLRGTVAFKGNLHIAYLEQGPKDHLIRRPAKIKQTAPKP